MRERIRRFMIGRYGMDNLGRFLNALVLAAVLLSLFFPRFASLALVLLICQYFRVFSRNTYRRAQENRAYLELRNRVMNRISARRQRFLQRKTHRFYRCPACRQTLRVPRGKGKIALTCPRCRTQFVRKS